MKKGEHVIVDIEGLTPRGDGRGTVDGRELVVPRSVPGDRAEVFVSRKRKGRFEGVVDDLIHPGIERRDPPCSHFGLCGGCRWQDFEYSKQLALKESMVRDAFERHGVAVRGWHGIAASPQVYNYRNKMEFSFGSDRDGKPLLGLHVRERYNRVFDLEACHLQSETSNRIVDSVRTRATKMGLPVYDLRSHEGLLRFLVIRDAKATAQVMVNLVVSSYPHDDVDQLMAGVLDEVGDEITTAIITRHSGKAQVAIGEEEFMVKGEGMITEICNGLEFQISSQSFFQTNTWAAEKLYARVTELAGDLSEAEVLDLYSGTGGMSLHLARAAHSVVGVEQVAETVRDARGNAQRNAIGNCTFLADQAEETLRELADGDESNNFDVVVLDPPRAGVHKKALQELIHLGPPTIVYVSCNPETLADDLADLVEGGYQVEEVQPFDLFPHTPHCEAVTRLRRGSAWRGKVD
ncbi:MAG: 23S rRNA (uracil(1939)-C(5))-methyltransferase RlmD [Candidatus Latescibacterota bacterium]|nr:23S rRNA (uracil(1939)-C(5))-methyltransferase RlmD [Candidatus Latescibacterota bacterium]